MAKHEFGIMKSDPVKGCRYDEYVPQKYDCISVDDECVERVAAELIALKCYAHTLDAPIDGLAYCGITLIPPEAIEQFISLIENQAEMTDLRKLLREALKKNRFVIHFGL